MTTYLPVGEPFLGPRLAPEEEHSVRFSNGYAFHALATIGELTETGRFWLPVDKTSRSPPSPRRTA